MSIHVRHNTQSKDRSPFLALVVGVLLATCAHCLYEHRYCPARQRSRQGPVYSIAAQEQRQTGKEEIPEKIEVTEPMDITPEAVFLVDTSPRAVNSAETEQENLAEGVAPEDTEYCYPQFTPNDHELAETDTPKTVEKTDKVDLSYIPPQYKSTPHPTYPPTLKRKRIEGSVRVRITVSESGKPTHLEIINSTHPDFVAPTKDKILREWLFEPAKKNGTNVAAIVTTTVHFEV